MEGHPARSISKPIKNIFCLICTRRFATSAALRDHHQALHRHASLPQPVVTHDQNGNGSIPFPVSPMTDAPSHPPENEPLPPPLHRAQSSSVIIQQNDTQALHSLLGALSISPTDPGLVRDESSVTNSESHIGRGWTVLKDDELPDDIKPLVNSLPAR